MKKVAIIGIQGVPAQYGGFETLVENLLDNYPKEEFDFTVFCSASQYVVRQSSYKGAHLHYLNLKSNGVQSVLYDIIAMLYCTKGYDTILVLGVSGCIFLPIFRLFNHSNLIINIDGVESKRQKWGRIARLFLALSEKSAVRYADTVISDNKAIQEYVKQKYNRQSKLIAYGGDQALRNVDDNQQSSILKRYHVKPAVFALAICRIEPENNCEAILESFKITGLPLVFVGNYKHSKYSRSLFDRYRSFSNIHMLDSIYDIDVLFTLRNNCKLYIHGHSAGGTNPSLVEAMHFGKPILAFDVVYNRETTSNEAYYWKNPQELIMLLTSVDSDNCHAMKVIADNKYTWKRISEQYFDLLNQRI